MSFCDHAGQNPAIAGFFSLFMAECSAGASRSTYAKSA
jgi:hypothetical protein